MHMLADGAAVGGRLGSLVRQPEGRRPRGVVAIDATPGKVPTGPEILNRLGPRLLEEAASG